MIFGAFKGTITEKVLFQLPFAKKDLIESSREGIHDFVDKISHTNAEMVIVLGEYSGIDREKIRIETTCTNKFRNTTNGKNLQQISIPYFFTPDEKFKITTGIGNSWCNLVSYEILTHSHNLSYTFLHIPEKFSLERAVEGIMRQLLH